MGGGYCFLAVVGGLVGFGLLLVVLGAILFLTEDRWQKPPGGLGSRNFLKVGAGFILIPLAFWFLLGLLVRWFG